MNIYLQLHHEFMQLSRTVRAFSGLYGLPVSIAEAHLLWEIEAKRVQVARDAVWALGTDKVTVSRLVNALIKKKLVAIEHHASDKRLKILNLSKQGHKVTDLAHQRGNKLISTLAQRLSVEEQFEINQLFGTLSDCAGAAPALFSAKVYFLRPEMRRFVRVMGFMRGHLIKALNLSEYEVLSLIENSQFGMSASDIAKNVGMEASNLSVMLARFQKQGLIKRKASNTDARKLVVQLNPSGRQIFNQAGNEISKYLGSLFQAVEKKKVKRLTELLARFGAQPGLATFPEVLQERIEIVPLESLKDLERARAVYVEELVRNHKHVNFPEILLPLSNATNIGLYEEDLLVGVCSILWRGVSGSLNAFWVPAKLGRSGHAKNLMLSTLQVFFNSNPAKKVSIDCQHAIKTANDLGSKEEGKVITINKDALISGNVI